MCKQGETRLIVVRGKIQGIDKCIYPLVKALNGGGIETVASCCGHGIRFGNIALRDGRELVIIPDYETSRELERFMSLAPEPFNCPACGRLWDTNKHNSCQCGASEIKTTNN